MPYQLILLCALLLFSFPTQALGETDKKETRARVCKQLYKQKQLLASAQCYAELAFSVGKQSLKQKEKRYQKGRWLRNAMILMTKAAKVQKDVGKKSFYYEKAKEYAQLYLTQKLYESAHQQRLAKVRLVSVTNKVGYALLSITTKHLKSAIEIQGFQFNEKGTGAWSQRVRPGRYVIRITYPSTPTEVKAISVSHGEPKLLAFSPPIKRKKVSQVRRTLPPVRPTVPKSTGIPAWTWVVVATGGAMIVAGGVVLGLGTSSSVEMDAMLARAKSGNGGENDTANRYNELARNASWQLPLGASLLGAGIASIGLGLLLQSVTKKTSTAVSPTARTQSHVSLFDSSNGGLQ